VLAQSNQEVGGLDVLVNNLLLLGMVERIVGLLEQAGDLGRRGWLGAATLPQPAGQGVLFAVGHD